MLQGWMLSITVREIQHRRHTRAHITFLSPLGLFLYIYFLGKGGEKIKRLYSLTTTTYLLQRPPTSSTHWHTHTQTHTLSSHLFRILKEHVKEHQPAAESTADAERYKSLLKDIPPRFFPFYFSFSNRPNVRRVNHCRPIGTATERRRQNEPQRPTSLLLYLLLFLFYGDAQQPGIEEHPIKARGIHISTLELMQEGGG